MEKVFDHLPKMKGVFRDNNNNNLANSAASNSNGTESFDGSDSESDHDEGEKTILMERMNDGVDDEDDAAPESIQKSLDEFCKSQRSLAAPEEASSAALSQDSTYGYPLSKEEATKLMPPGPGGLIWHSLLINGDPFDEEGKLKKGLSERDFDLQKRKIKPRRSSLPILADDFYKSLTRIEGPQGARFIFHGVLNGWPSLRTFEVISIERKRQKPEFYSPAELMSGHRVWAHIWSANKEGVKGQDPTIKENGLIFRIKFRGAPWTGTGWSQESPGFSFWYESQEPKPVLSYGTDMIEAVDPSPICTKIHMIAHRYGRLKENPKDLLTYHSMVLLEWDHGKYCTIIEAAYLNGLSGYRGKSQFFDDMHESITQMYKCFPPEMISPWLTNAAEVRATDVPSKSLEEFKQFIKKYEGNHGRFIDPQYCFSHPARLTYRSKKDMARYLNNYIRRDVSYSQLKRNCQTLAADLCAFVAGKREVLPYHPVNRIEYKNRSYLFLYEPDMYDQRKPSSLQANELRR